MRDFRESCEHTKDNDMIRSFYDTSAERTMVEENGVTRAKEQQILCKTMLYMAGAVLLTAVSSYITVSTGATYSLISSGIWWILIIAELITVFSAQGAMSKSKVGLSKILFVVYSVINGITLSTVFLVYELGSIVTIFVIAAVLFASLAAYGIVTKRDLTALGSVGIMGIVGVVMLTLVNIFIKSSSLSLALAVIGLSLFIGITAYDTQKIKSLAGQAEGKSETTLALFGALMLYLDFVNIFLYLLRLFAKRN